MLTFEEVKEYWPNAIEALNKGTRFEYKPESIESGDDTYVYYCESCKRYHMDSIARGLIVEDGIVYDTFWTVDTDGDWGSPEMCGITDLYYPEWYKRNLHHESLQETWKQYYRHVIETGKDELGAFTIERTRKAVLKIFLNGSITGVYLRKVSDRAGKGQTWYGNLRPFPKSVTDYFMLKDVGGRGVGPWLIDAEEIKTLDDVRKLAGDTITWTSRSKYPNVVANGLVTLDLPIADMYVEAQLKRLAKQALAEE